MSDDSKVIVGGREFAFRPMSASEAIQLFIELVGIVGEPLFKAFVTSGKDSADAQAMGATIIGLLAKNLNPSQISGQMERVFSKTTCDGKTVLLDTTFADRKTLEAFQVFLAALRYQYADFLAVGPLSSLFAKLETGLPSSIQST